MARGTATVAAALALVVLAAAPAAATTVPVPPPAHLRIADTTVPLHRFILNSTTCGQVPPVPCVVDHGLLRSRVPISERVRTPFGGAITVELAPNTDSISITYGRSGRQPVWRFDPLQPVVWPVPGSGTYYMFIEIASHDEWTQSRITYAVALYAPRP
jgi:hypothetical protein